MHVPPDGSLHAHSVAEAYLYVSLTYCPACMRRPVRVAADLTRAADGWVLPVNCAGCGRTSDLRFEMASPQPGSNDINPSGEPSRLIDVAGWLALFRVIADSANQQADKAEARALALEAAQCLDEALRFYGPDDLIAPPSAFFAENSRDRARKHPEQFQRARLLELRLKLPVATRDLPGWNQPRKKPWWKFW